ncbi:hypothetical protein [Halomarina rubra]|uniref:Uncharacterized protein n=1 Tax=Halomarina rubra TaxID=2071873 RepID=A0ABD6B1C0_9EURY|nr:hypothetical protein [Halomarina rubra]
MRTERVAAESEPTVESGLAHAPDPTRPGVVTVYDPESTGPALASQWLSVDEDLLCDATDWC